MKTNVRLLAKAVAEFAVTLPPTQVHELAAAAADRLQMQGRREQTLFPRLLQRMLRRFGPVEADLEAAQALPEADRRALESALQKALNRPVSLSVRENQTLIGGARLRVGDEHLDASLRGALQRLPSLLS